MRRRLHLVPFAVTIAPEQLDLELSAKLLAEWDGILGWMLEGCADWRRRGLAPPAAVVDAGADYVSDEDLVGQWIAEACVAGKDEAAASKALYASWSSWARDAGLEPGSQRDFAEQLRARGFRQHRSARLRGWVGLSLRHRAVDPDHGGDR